MDSHVIYSKTVKGLKTANAWFSGLSSQAKQVLTLVDGRLSAADILAQTDKLTEDKLEQLLTKLENEGYIRQVVSHAAVDDWSANSSGSVSGISVEILDDEDDGETLDFTNYAPDPQADFKAAEEAARQAAEQAQLEAERAAQEKAKAEEAARKKAETAARAKAEAQEKARIEAERLAREAAEQKTKEVAARAKAEEEARQKAEAARQAKAAAEEQVRLNAEREKAKAEEAARLQAEARAKAEAEEKARVEAERLAREAREAAAAKAEAEAERKAREEAEEKARLEAERAEREKAEAEEAARVKAEAEALAKAEAEEKARIEAERIVREEAERQAREAVEAQARAEEEARQQAEAERRAREDAEEKARLEAERAEREKADAAEATRLKAEAEAQAKADAEETARQEAERLAHEESERKAKEEAEARAQAENEARLEAERKAREEAEIRAKAEAEDRARIEAERQAQKEAERIAREEEKAKREAEKQAQREAENAAREEAKRIAREEKEEKARLKAEEKAQAKALRGSAISGKWMFRAVMTLLILIPLTVLLLVGLLQFINLSMLVQPVEKLASDSIGEPVTVRDVHASLFPQPHLILGGVAVGSNAAAIKVDAVHISPVTSTLFERTKTLKSLEVESLTLAPADFGRAVQWVNAAAGSGKLKIERIEFKRVAFRIPGLALTPFDGLVGQTSSGQFNHVELSSADKGLTIKLTPQNGSCGVELTASDWQPPLGGHLAFEEITARGMIGPDQVIFSQVEGRAYGGTFKAHGTVNWGRGLSASGGFELSNANLSRALSDFGSSASADGSLNASATFTSKADEASKLAEAPEIRASFDVLDGKIGRIDLVHLLLSGGSQSQAGDATRFDKLSGSMQFGDGHYKYSQMSLQSAQVRASGNFDIQPNHAVSGKLSAELTAKSRHLQASFGLGGTAENVKIQ